MMGLTDFDPEYHLRLFDGLNPHNGERLPGMRAVQNRQGGWDVTFNQPKAVSVAEQVAGDDRIAAVRDRAESKAMDLLESQIRVAVRKKSQLDAPKVKGWKYPERISANVVYAAFRHPASRSGDPHSHTHYVVYNASWDGAERQWKSAVTRHVDVKAVADTYHKEMAKGLRKLGYDAKWDGKELSLPSFPKDIHEEFSRRHNAIKAQGEAMEAKIGKPMGGKAKGKLSLYNRPEKAEYVPIDVRRKNWMSRLTDSQKGSLSGFVRKAKATVERLKVRLMTQRHLSRDAYSPEVGHESRGIER